VGIFVVELQRDVANGVGIFIHLGEFRVVVRVNGEEELDSDEIPSDTEEVKPTAGDPNFRIVKDANGNDRLMS
jgi:hypothetical protein